MGIRDWNQTGDDDRMRPLQISAETAVKLAEKLNIPLEQLMHMPTPILMKKLMELAEQEKKISDPCN
jgi:hypothetical protein